MIWTSAVTLTNARVVTGEGTAESVRFASRVLAIGDPPRRGDAVVDVRGSFVLPGLVNAHDHLELNHYGRMKFRDRYGNASEWIGDMRPRLADDAAIRKAGSHPLSDRLFVGALKNVEAMTAETFLTPTGEGGGRRLRVPAIRTAGFLMSSVSEAV